MAFHYNNTCPVIDTNINYLKSDIESHLIDMLSDCSPMLEGEQRDVFVKSYVEQIYSSLEYCFEEVRKSNVDMRENAEIQISKAEEELSDANYNIAELETKIEDLETELKTLEDELSNHNRRS